MKEYFTTYQSKSKFNRVVYSTQKRLLFAFIMVCIAIIWFIFAIFRYNFDVQHSSSAIGTSMVFQRSNAKVTLSDIYLTKNEDALIARLSLDDQSNIKLPYKGSDFAAYLYSEKLQNYAGKWVNLIFVKLSTSGDYFLIIPYPDKDVVYTVTLMNKKYLATDARQNNSMSASPSDMETKPNEEQLKTSLASQLSKQKYQLNDDKSLTPSIQSDDFDIISMRLTSCPSIQTDKFKPITIDTTLFDANKKPVFENLFNAVYKKSLMTSTENELKQLQSQLDSLKKTQNELNERLIVDPTNSQISESLNELKNTEDGLKEKMKKAVLSKQLYTSLEYDKKSMFLSPLYFAYVLGKE